MSTKITPEIFSASFLPQLKKLGSVAYLTTGKHYNKQGFVSIYENELADQVFFAIKHDVYQLIDAEPILIKNTGHHNKHLRGHLSDQSMFRLVDREYLMSLLEGRTKVAKIKFEKKDPAYRAITPKPESGIKIPKLKVEENLNRGPQIGGEVSMEEVLKRAGTSSSNLVDVLSKIRDGVDDQKAKEAFDNIAIEELNKSKEQAIDQAAKALEDYQTRYMPISDYEAGSIHIHYPNDDLKNPVYDTVNKDWVEDPKQELGVRHNEGKPRWSLVDFKSLEPLVRSLEKGAEEYGEYNWQKGLKTSEIYESLFRHVVDLRYNRIDKASGASIIGAIFFNAMAFQYMQDNRPDLDDLNK